MVCGAINAICGGVHDGYAYIGRKLEPIDNVLGDLSERIGLPRDTLSKAIVSFVASCAFAALFMAFAMLLGASFSPMAILAAGTVAGIASFAHGVSTRIIKEMIKQDHMPAWGNLLLRTAMLLGSSYLVSTFLPYRVDVIATLIMVAVTFALFSLPRGDGRSCCDIISAPISLNHSDYYFTA